MPLDPVALAAAASFTVGCAGIHALRRHADVLTLAKPYTLDGIERALEHLGTLRVGSA